MTLELRLAIRYLLYRPYNGFTSLTVRLSIIGIMLGVAVLISVSSVMNGFQTEIKKSLYDLTDHITLVPYVEDLTWKKTVQELEEFEGIDDVIPFVLFPALFKKTKNAVPVFILGLQPQKHQDEELSSWLIHSPAENHVLLTDSFMAQHQFLKGDTIKLILPRFEYSFFGPKPAFSKLTVDGGVKNIIEIADHNIIYMPLDHVLKLMDQRYISGIKLRVHDPFAVDPIAKNLSKKMANQYSIQPWTKRFRTLFDSLRLQKTVMLIVFSLIVMVAAFNLVSGLVMITTEKKVETAVLRTMGMTRLSIMKIYLFFGSLLSFIGIVLGVILGLIFSYNVVSISHFIEKIFQIKLVSKNVFLIDYLPSSVNTSEVVTLVGISLLLSVLAILYPAIKAARVLPAEVLRYE